MAMVSVPTPNLASPVQHAMITNAAVLLPELLRRDVQTCGYVSGNSGQYMFDATSRNCIADHPAASPLTCPAGYTCTSQIYGYIAWACCKMSKRLAHMRRLWRSTMRWTGPRRMFQHLHFHTDLVIESSPPVTTISFPTDQITCSSEADPSCFYYVRSSSLGDTAFHSSLGCGPSSDSVAVLAIATNGKNVVTTKATTTAAATTSDQTDDDTPITASDSSASSSTDNSSPESSSSETSLVFPTHHVISNGGIAAIVVVGVIVVVVFIVAVMCIRRRRHKTNDRNRYNTGALTAKTTSTWVDKLRRTNQVDPSREPSVDLSTLK